MDGQRAGASPPALPPAQNAEEAATPFVAETTAPEMTPAPIPTLIPGSESARYYSAAPQTVFETPASENKLGGQPMYCDGTVAAFGTSRNLDYVIIRTALGDMWLIDMCIRAERFSGLTVGGETRVFFLYMGWSEVMDAASGAIVEISTAQAPVTDVTDNLRLAIHLFESGSHYVPKDVLEAYMSRTEAWQAYIDSAE